MSSRVAIVAAMAREIRPLVRGWKLERNARGVTVYSSERTVAVVAGMGRRRGEIAADTAFHYGPIHQILSVGLAGGLHGGIAAGSVYVAEKIVDGASGEVFELSAEKTLEPVRRAVLVTADKIAFAAEKRRLSEHFAADLVDMEAAAVAAVARDRGVPFMALKAVSDGADFEMPGMERFAKADGGFNEGAFARHVAIRPWMWWPAMRLGRNSSVAINRLCAELERYLAGEASNGWKPSERTGIGVG